MNANAPETLPRPAARRVDPGRLLSDLPRKAVVLAAAAAIWFLADSRITDSREMDVPSRSVRRSRGWRSSAGSRRPFG